MFLECSHIVVKKLITRKDKAQFCGLVNNALHLINKMFELISLKFQILMKKHFFFSKFSKNKLKNKKWKKIN